MSRLDTMMIHGGRVEYAVYGEGDRTVVFHHGSPFTAGCLDLDRLAEVIPEGVQILAVSRPGFGETDPSVVGRHLETTMEDITAVLKLLDIGRPAATAGFSLGGPFAVQFAQYLHPHLPLVLVSSVAPVPSGQEDAMLEGMAQMQQDIFLGVRYEGFEFPPMMDAGALFAGLREGAQGDDTKVFADPDFAELIRADLAHALQNGTAGMEADVRTWEAMHERFPRHDAVVRMIHGTHDNAAPIDMGYLGGFRELIRRRDEYDEFEELMTAGHYVLYSHWKRVMDALEAII